MTELVIAGSFQEKIFAKIKVRYEDAKRLHAVRRSDAQRFGAAIGNSNHESTRT